MKPKPKRIWPPEDWRKELALPDTIEEIEAGRPDKNRVTDHSLEAIKERLLGKKKIE